jgi:hypothetical protein
MMQRSILLACALCAAFAAQAEPGLQGQRTAQHLGDGNGHGVARRGATFTTGNGTQGAATRAVSRGEDGAIGAGGRTAVSGEHGSAQSSRRFARSADGQASAQRQTTATNADTGVTFEGSTAYTQGSGVSRSGSCRNAAGETVTCGPTR